MNDMHNVLLEQLARPRFKPSHTKRDTFIIPDGYSAIRDSNVRATGEIELNDQRQKLDAGKSDPMLVEEDLAYALEAVNRVLDYGKAKYGRRGGWRDVDIERYRSAHARHRRSVMQEGLSSRDEESGLLHLAHEVCNGLFVLQTVLAGLTPSQRRRALTYNQPVPVEEILNAKRSETEMAPELARVSGILVGSPFHPSRASTD